ncbi:MAG: sigma-70 family RNA polymerase sigma factor, partial [Ilumatobacteraceae bacterium]
MTGYGAVDVWRAFYERSFPDVTQYAMRLTGGRTAAAEDLVHDGYLAMVRAWQRGALDGLETGRLMVTVRSLFLNGLRHDRRKGRRLRLVHDSFSVHSEPSMVELDELLRTVSDRQRAAGGPSLLGPKYTIITTTPQRTVIKVYAPSGMNASVSYLATDDLGASWRDVAPPDSSEVNNTGPQSTLTAISPTHWF